MRTRPLPVARLAFVGLALLAYAIPVPAGWVEDVYSKGAYAAVQPPMTSLSNAVPFALFDALVVGSLVAVGFAVARALVRAGRSRQLRPLAILVVNLLTAVACLYLAFLFLWGLNYEREPLTAKLAFDPAAAQPEAAVRLGLLAAGQLNTLHATAHAAGFPDWDGLPHDMHEPFDAIQSRLAPGTHPVPGKPKWSLLTYYFQRAGVSGMTDPFFLEILVDRGLLPFERPFVAAHEWAHLAGYAAEAEANFVGWLTCVNGSVSAAYSGWLYLYAQVLTSLPPADRGTLVRGLNAGPRADLRAIAERARLIRPALQSLSWRVYDRYLKANRVQQGVANYDRALVLVLGTRFTDGWMPVVKTSEEPGLLEKRLRR